MNSDLDINLPDRTQDDVYLAAVESALDRVMNRFKPDLLLYLSGVDILESDKLGRLSVSLDGCRQRDEMVLSQAFDLNIPIAVSMGGGYNKNLSTLISAHAQTFRVAYDIFG